MGNPTLTPAESAAYNSPLVVVSREIDDCLWLFAASETVHPAPEPPGPLHGALEKGALKRIETSARGLLEAWLMGHSTRERLHPGQTPVTPSEIQETYQFALEFSRELYLAGEL